MTVAGVALSDRDRALLAAEAGDAAALAMALVVQMARALGAATLLDITGAHVDGCLYHGQVSLDFVDRLVAGGGRVAVPTTTNVGSLDLIHPQLAHGPGQGPPAQSAAAAAAAAARRLMQAHLALGCAPSFTCAPYHTRARPARGAQIAWGESNAIVFANSVCGARTNRYGDFIDLACALTGRAPAWGLHLDGPRLGGLWVQLEPGLSTRPATDSLCVAVGAAVGRLAGDRVPVIEGLPPDTPEDGLKALGAMAAATGAVALFHAVGLTPEAPDLASAFGGRVPPGLTPVRLTRPQLTAELDRLSAAAPVGAPVAAVCLGTPHASPAECRRLAALVAATPPRGGVAVWVNLGRETLAALEADGTAAALRQAGVRLVVDTCTYLTPLLGRVDGVVLTNSGKWALYAPGNVGLRPAFADLDDCLAAAAAGVVLPRRGV